MALKPTSNKTFMSLLALLIVPISGLSIDIYVPSLPAVSVYFDVAKSYVQLTITAYMLGLGLAQLFAGSLSDTYGRTKPFFIALCFYIIATLLVPWSTDIRELLALRFFQGVTAAMVVVPMRAVLPDLYEGRELNKMMTYLTMVWAIGPIIAPAIGGYLQHYFGWKASFYFLAIYCIILFIMTLIFLPETSRFRHPFHFSNMMKRYRDLLFNRQFLLGLILSGMLYSLIILFSVVGPFLIQNVLHYSPIQFGHFSLLMGFAWFLGIMTARFLIDISIRIKMGFCLLGLFVTAMIMLIISVTAPLSIYNIIIPTMIILWLGGASYPVYFARNMSLFPQIAGSASALFGASVFLLAGLTSALGTLLKANNEFPLACGYVVLTLIALLLYILDNRMKPN